MWVSRSGDASNCYLQVPFTSSAAPLIGRKKTDGVWRIPGACGLRLSLQVRKGDG